ncbi:MAG: porin family protein [bacterium]|nr:porin family protein [bacterium]
MTTTRTGVLLALMLAAGSGLALAGVDVTPQFGFRLGGELEGETSDERVDDTAAYGITFDFELSPTTGVVALWSHQGTEFSSDDLLPLTAPLDLDVDYIHVGSYYSPESTKRFRGFVLFSVGGTWIDTDQPGFSGDRAFSIMGGGGVEVPLTERLAFRADARGYLTLADMEIDGECGGNRCRFEISGDGAFQVDLLVGLTIAF